MVFHFSHSQLHFKEGLTIFVTMSQDRGIDCHVSFCPPPPLWGNMSVFLHLGLRSPCIEGRYPSPFVELDRITIAE